MDNDLYTLDEIKKNDIYCEICEACDHWKPFNATTGFCVDVNNWHSETCYDDWCEQWKELKNENITT